MSTLARLLSVSQTILLYLSKRVKKEHTGVRVESTVQDRKVAATSSVLACCADLEQSQGKFSPVVKPLLFPA